ncbi:MAG: shikimate kinase [Bacteriovoracaceae bacterium]
MKYFICGFSGAGKTTLLNRIKSSGKYPGHLFVDLDLFILTQHQSSSLGDLIEEKGWDWFRRAEKETLENLLKSPDIWIALGGGTLDQELALSLERDKEVKGYWLDTDFETCWQRIQNDRNRPLVLRGKRELKALYDQRRGFYQKFERLLDT